ncbi:MAG: SIMPL domain-containing protein [Paracoccaceae bacterium]
MVNGVGEIAVVPDLAILTLEVSHEANTAEEAMSLVSTDMTAILKSLEKETMAERDIQTARIQVQPINRLDNRLHFHATNQVTVRVRDLSGLGRILGQTISNGANQVGGWSSGVRFDVSDPVPYEAEARKAAVQNAIAKAKDLAEAAGARIGDIKEIRESGRTGRRAIEMARFSEGAEVPVAEGEVTIQSQVAMVFELIQ